MQNACLIKKASICMFVVLSVYAGACSAEEVTPDQLTAVISKITYQDNDEYVVEITIENKFIETVALKGYEMNFSVQSEVLGQWIELGRRRASGPVSSAGLAMSRGRSWKITELVVISLLVPRLYRNHDGDVNVLFRYKLKFTGAASPGDCKDEGESTYWVTPKTDRWVLREGM